MLLLAALACTVAYSKGGRGAGSVSHVKGYASTRTPATYVDFCSQPDQVDEFSWCLQPRKQPEPLVKSKWGAWMLAALFLGFLCVTSYIIFGEEYEQ